MKKYCMRFSFVLLLGLFLCLGKITFAHASDGFGVGNMVDVYSMENELIQQSVRIVEETEHKIVVDIDGFHLTYYKDSVLIKKSDARVDQKSVPSSDATHVKEGLKQEPEPPKQRSQKTATENSVALSEETPRMILDGPLERAIYDTVKTKPEANQITPQTRIELTRLERRKDDPIVQMVFNAKFYQYRFYTIKKSGSGSNKHYLSDLSGVVVLKEGKLFFMKKPRAGYTHDHKTNERIDHLEKLIEPEYRIIHNEHRLQILTEAICAAFGLNYRSFNSTKEGSKYIVTTEIQWYKGIGFVVHVDGSGKVVSVYRRLGS